MQLNNNPQRKTFALSPRGTIRNRNSEALDALLLRGRKKTELLSRAGEKKLCWRYLTGVCPRLLLMRTPYTTGKCLFTHKKDYLFCPTPSMRKTLTAEIEKIISTIEKKELPLSAAHTLYVKKKEELIVHTINKNKDIAEVIEKRIEEIEVRYEKEKVPLFFCRVCPGRVPWTGKAKKIHERSTIHLAYKEMREYLERYSSKKRIFSNGPAAL